MTSLIPLYLREYYKDDALFKDSKIITALYNDCFEGNVNNDLSRKVAFDQIDESHLKTIHPPSHINLQKLAIEKSDSIIFAQDIVSEEVRKFVSDQGKPTLSFHDREEFPDAYLEFYKQHIK